MTNKVSRRDLLKQAAVAGAAAAVPLGSAACAPTASTERTWETLTESEGETLEAIVARLIPSDDSGPGATEARAARYIDRGLGGGLASSREAYRVGLAAVDRYAGSSKGGRFSRLTADDQDEVLRDMEDDRATGFTPSAAAFFGLLRTHTIQGTFSDPAYGGNDGFIGWELIGYPGVRTAVTPDLQRMDVAPTARQVSAYDFPAFADSKAGRTHGG